jgi:MoxR-like ATPase
VLLEGVPGLGKTTLLRTLARTLQLKYSRIQFTPDLMPADIVGSMIMENDDRGNKVLRFQFGPIFANVVLADEINRATPKTQSALLEAMQERTVTSGNTTHELEAPFLVMATQNPIEMEGTYPLPEAQLDRFLMKILVTYPAVKNWVASSSVRLPATSRCCSRCSTARRFWKCAQFAARCW